MWLLNKISDLKDVDSKGLSVKTVSTKFFYDAVRNRSLQQGSSSSEVVNIGMKAYKTTAGYMQDATSETES